MTTKRYLAEQPPVEEDGTLADAPAGSDTVRRRATCTAPINFWRTNH